MPRKRVSESVRNWEVSMNTKTMTKVLDSKKELGKGKFYTEMVEYTMTYDDLSSILDNYGITGANRGMYRSYVEECLKAKKTYSGMALSKKITALADKYAQYGCNRDVLIEIAKRFGVKLMLKTTRILTFGLG